MKRIEWLFGILVLVSTCREKQRPQAAAHPQIDTFTVPRIVLEGDSIDIVSFLWEKAYNDSAARDSISIYVLMKGARVALDSPDAETIITSGWQEIKYLDGCRQVASAKLDGSIVVHLT